MSCLTDRENPCQGVRKNKETPRDYYANDAVWKAVYQKGEIELQEAMDLAYLTGQRPADVRLMRVDDLEGVYLRVGQGKTSKKIRILMEVDGQKNSLGLLIERIIARPKKNKLWLFDREQIGEEGLRAHAMPEMGRRQVKSRG